MSRYRLTRREILQSLTVGAGSLAFGASTPGEARGLKAAAGAAAKLPRRLVIFPIANGVSDYPDFGTVGSTPTNFVLGPMLKPLEDLGLRDQLVCLENLEMKRDDNNVDQHFCGLTQVLTGPFPPNNATQHSAHISLDQYLATNIGSGLPFGQLYMGTMCDSISYSYLASGTSVSPNSNPVDVYNQVFANLQPQGLDAATRRRLLRRQTVLDSVTQDLKSFIKRLPAEDRDRAGVQASAIQDMEQRISTLLNTVSSCNKPMIDTAVDYRSDTQVPQTLRAMVDLTVAALACDQARVVMFHSYAREYHPPNFHCPWPPVNVPDWSFHELSHDLDGSPNFGAFKAAKAFHFQVAGELANKLRAIPEMGGTMLDHTIIFIPTEIGRGHTPAGLQFVTLGGGGLGVKTGQYLQFGTNFNIGGGMPHQRLLVALLNALGLPDTTFGDTATTGTGPLPGYLA